MRRTGFLALLLVMAAASALFADRAIIERRVWYVNSDQKIAEARFWTIFLGNYDKNLTRNFPGEGAITFPASINYQLVSSGYIEGNGAGARGPVRKLLPSMLIRVAGQEPAVINIAAIDYIYDWGTKVALTDGRKGDFLINAEGGPIEPKRFALREFREIESFGEKVLNSTAEHDSPIIALAFTREGAQRAAREPVSE